MAVAEAQETAVTSNLEEGMLDSMRSAAEEAAELLRSIGSPYRLMILCLLMEKEKTVTEICEAIGARQSLTSQHLTRLRLDGLVKAERRGHFAYYSLTDTLAKDIISILYKHYCEQGVVPEKSAAPDDAAPGAE